MRDGDLKPYEGFAGCFAVKASNKIKPTVYDVDKSPLDESSGKLYAGCYVDVKLSIKAWEANGGKGVSAYLKGVRFVREGDAFAGGGVARADDFDDIAVSDGGSVADYLL